MFYGLLDFMQQPFTDREGEGSDTRRQDRYSTCRNRLDYVTGSNTCSRKVPRCSIEQSLLHLHLYSLLINVENRLSRCDAVFGFE